MIVGIAPVAQAEDQTVSPGQLVQRSRHFGEHGRMAVPDIQDERNGHQAPRGQGQDRQRRPDLERRSGQDVIQADPVVAEAFSATPQPSQLIVGVAGVMDPNAETGHTSDAIMSAGPRGLTVRQPYARCSRCEVHL